MQARQLVVPPPMHVSTLLAVYLPLMMDVMPIQRITLLGDYDKAVKKIDGCKTRAELQALNEKMQHLWNYQPYISYMTQKYNTLPQ